MASDGPGAEFNDPERLSLLKEIDILQDLFPNTGAFEHGAPM